MAASLYDSAIYRDLLRDGDTAALFSDTAEVRAMLLVEGALAKAQGELGMIPELSARAIHRAALELQIDPGGLSEKTGQNAVPVPALVARFREAMQAPEHAQYVHWGATSQDVIDTALVLRLRQVLALAETRLKTVILTLGALASEHAELPMAGRTYGQAAVPTSFGAVAAAWGRPLMALHARLPALRDEVLQVSLGGAAGTLSAMEGRGAEVRSKLAEGLGLGDPGHSWHAERQGMAALCGWAAEVTGALGKMGEDLILMAQSGIGEVRLTTSGGSSTMPQKQNPVGPSLLVALARHTGALAGVVQQAQVHRQQRDAAAWIGEWLSLPEVCHGLGRSLALSETLVEGIEPQPEAMRAGIDREDGMLFAEALQFRLAGSMPRPEAQSKVKELCVRAADEGRGLPEIAKAEWPDSDFSAVFDPVAQLGEAPEESRAFAASAGTLTG